MRMANSLLTSSIVTARKPNFWKRPIARVRMVCRGSISIGGHSAGKGRNNLTHRKRFMSLNVSMDVKNVEEKGLRHNEILQKTY